MHWSLSVFLLFLGHFFTYCTSLRLTSSHEQKPVIIRPVGTDVTLDCAFVDDDDDDGVTSNAIAWYFNNIPKASSGEGTLLLENVQPTDEFMGWYTCAASSTTERYELDFLLVIGGEVPAVSFLPPSPYIAQLSTRVELPCFSGVFPQPKARWFRQNGVEIIEGDGNGFRIDPTTQSLIFNITGMLFDRTFRCQASSLISSSNYTYEVTRSNTDVPLLLTNIHNNRNDPYVEIPAGDNSIELPCIDSNMMSFSYKWFRNGSEIVGETGQQLTVTRPPLNSGYYCCKIYNSSEAINTHCTTILFRSNPTIKIPSPIKSQFYLQPGRKAALICLGQTQNPPIHYDPPDLNWVDPNNNTQNDYTDNRGLAYRLVDIGPDTNGEYTCTGNNFIGTVRKSVVLQYVGNNNVGSTNVIVGGLAEYGGRDDSYEPWTLSEDGNAHVTNYMNENVFMLSFSDSQSIDKTWIVQEVSLQGAREMYISGRMRVSQGSADVYPVIQVCRDDTCQDDAVIAELEHPVRGSEAWQWVEGTVSDNGTSEVVIRLALKNYEVTTQKRQVDNGSAFFDDISVMVTRPPGPEEDDNGDDVMLYIVIGAAGGGAIAILLVAIVLVICCCFCCRRDKNSAQPMRKLTTLIKKTSKRYHFRKPTPMKSGSPVPQEYEIPVVVESSGAYATLRTNNEESGTNGEYTTLNPHSLDEPNYYTTTLPHSGSPLRNARKEEAKGETDVGGVNMYLEVLPTDGKSPSPRGGNSPRGGSATPRGGSPVALTGLKSATEEPNDLPSPDILDGDLVDPYDYVNTDLGPPAI